MLITLKFIHSKGYAHTSLTSEHIMIVKMPKQQSVLVKIIGFANTVKTSSDKRIRNLNFFGNDPALKVPEE